MTIDRLTTRAMLVLTEYWLRQPFMRAELRAHDLGIAVRARLCEVYGDLTELHAPHLVYGIRSLELATGETPEALATLSRRVYRDLEERVACEPDPRMADAVQELSDALFPDGPDSLAALCREGAHGRLFGRDPDEPWFTRLQSVAVNEKTLMDAYRAWAAIEDALSMRARQYGLHDDSGRTLGAALGVRDKWLRLARALFTAVDVLPLGDAVRARMRELLSRSIDTIATGAIAGVHPREAGDTWPELSAADEIFEDDGDTLDFDREAFDVARDPTRDATP